MANKKIDDMSPFHLTTSDNPGNPLVSCVLTGDNYSTWARSMRNALKAKNKLGFVDGTVARPESSAPEFKAWEICNSMVIAWISNSLEKSMQGSVAYVDEAKSLWDDLKERFSQGNAPRIFQLKTQLSHLRQEGLTVAGYYTRLKALWDELDDYSNVSTCTCNAAKDSGKEKEMEKLYQFLMGLNVETYGNIRSQILSSEPLPGLSKAYSIVVQEERRRIIVHGQEERVEGAFYVSKGRKDGRGSLKPDQGNRPQCDHCHKIGHNKERCWELVGYPSNWEPRQGTQRKKSAPKFAAMVTTQPGGAKGIEADQMVVQPHFAGATHIKDPSIGQGASQQGSNQIIPSLTGEEYQQLKNLLNKMKGPSDQMEGENLIFNSDMDWILDTGASIHLTGNFRYLRKPQKLSMPCSIQLPNGRTAHANLMGQVYLGPNLVLREVLYVPEFACNLISIGKLLMESNYSITILREFFFVQDPTSRMPIGVGELRGGVYLLRRVAPMAAGSAIKMEDYGLWHRRLGHPSRQALSYISGFSMNNMNSSPCDICMRAKQTRNHFPVSDNKASRCFELIHCDIWGPYSELSLSGARYFLTIVDDYSRGVWVYLLREKSEAYGCLIKFCNLIKTQFGWEVKIVRSDNGREFTSGHIHKFYLERGIIHQTSCVNTPQQNGRVERKHRHILNVARALKFQSGLPNKFWGEFVLTAAHLINITPTQLLSGKTPFELLFGKPPRYDHVKIFGSLCYAHRKTRGQVS